MKKTLGITVLLLSTRAFGDRPAPQVRIEANIVEIGPGVTSANFGLNLGHVYANFPSDMAAGDRVSGSIAAIPAGKSDAERSANLAALRNLEIRIGEVQVPVSAGLFVCPRVTAGRIDLQLLVDIKPLGRLFVEPKAAAPEVRTAFTLPVAAVAPGRSRILGAFGGDLSQTRVRIGDTPAHLVAESPRSCIFDVPEGPIGPATIEVREGSSVAAGPFRVIGLHLTPPEPIIHTGDTTSFSAEVYGLAGLAETLPLVLRNLSTGVVAMDGGNEQTLQIAPSEVSVSGTYAISRRLTGIHRGDYAVNVSVPWEEVDVVKETAPASGSLEGTAATGRKAVSLFGAIEKLPEGYKIVHGERGGFHAKVDSARPSLPLAWDEVHGVWTPPGYVPDASDPDRAFNRTRGGNAVWDDKSGRWIDAGTGEPLSDEQDGAGKQTGGATGHATGEIPLGGKAVSLPDAVSKLPAGYKIVRGKDAGFHAAPDTLRPGLPLAWDGAHGTWTPPGYVPNAGDPERAFNQTTGGNAVWDDKTGRWIDARTGAPVSYEQ